MSYQVLARKWRPRRFSELVGQEHVVKALAHALDHERTHHAYLFAGTRGIGKTTIARIFAKSINCEQGASAEPCGECAVCQAVDAGRFVDLLEIDAASNTGVDDVRELIENAQYAPTRGRFKVYLIDEVHMLSRSAFNALLKTLEEPPEHVKFLLATTDPDKLPMTVLSRCLKFNLKRLRPAQISGQLAHILEAEGIAFEQPAIEALALAADGSMRDGLSLLDQSLAYSGDNLSAEATRAMLGTVGHGDVLALVQALADGDGAALLARAASIGEHAADPGMVLDQLAALLHELQLQQLVPGHHADAGAPREALAQLATVMTAEEVQLFYQLATHGRRELELAPDVQTGFEMVLLRMLAFRPDADGRERPRGGGDGKTPAPAPRPAPAASAKPRSEARPVAVAEPPAPASAQPEAPHSSLFRDPSRLAEDWHAWVAQAGLDPPTAELARNAMPQETGETLWTLGLRENMLALAVEPMSGRLREKLRAALGRPVQLRFVAADDVEDTPAARLQQAAAARQSAAAQALADDPLVQGLQNELGAQVLPDSVRAV